MLAEKGELKAQNKNLYVASLVAQLGSFMMGYTLAYTSPAIPDMEDRGVLKTTDQISWFGVYIAELSSLDLRGMLVGVSHPFIGGGMLPVNALGCDDGSLGVLVLWGVCFLSTIFVALCVPETKGKSLEEITKDFNRYNRHL
ncbi:uncharacterized protein LOC117111441 isoform X2 [Anneissia japonica]|uniref:uncharacterized protein LOC117111441 isoform X2 n=1 Tax=Anneissia japonica TaxID=1529436 RepID=UPI0014258557|nr:uncharacterized protein LOC117111441 isoform X2 [Anneissia japonica]